MTAGAAVVGQSPFGPSISDREFGEIQGWFYREAGIHLPPSKKSLVAGRLARRLRHYRLASFGDYFRLATGGEERGESRMMVDLLTTNETSFFREASHFEFLVREVLAEPPRERPFRLWSAASSSGEEPYSLAMELDYHLGGRRWELLASDLSERVLERARRARYPLEAEGRIPPLYRDRYCLKGIRSQQGWLLVEPRLSRRVEFRRINLNGEWPALPSFDVVFLRNVMIYFDQPTKRRLVARIAERLLPGGYLFVGHAESLHGISDRFAAVCPSIYRKRSAEP